MKHPNITFLSHIRILFLTCCLLFLFAGMVVWIDAKIVFRMDGDIYVMNDDGTGRRRLTKNTETKDSYPRWSSDGKKIAFVRYMDKTKIQTSGELFIMNADGTNLKQLTDDNVGDNYPSWSPDGKKIAFRSRRSGQSEVHVIDLETLDIIQLTGVEGELGSTAPDWSPDGTQIVYEKFLRLKEGIVPKFVWVMSADGEQQEPLFPDLPLADALVLHFFPRWSADGQRVIFSEVKWLDNGDLEKIVVKRIGGRKQEIRDINDRLGNNWMGAGKCWMENDRAILFSIILKDKPNPNYDIYRYAFETQSLRRVTRDARNEKYPDWVEGTLSVSPQKKLPTQWGEKKQDLSQ